MQRDRERAKSNSSDGTFADLRGFGGFGPQGSIMSSIFGGRDLFDDSFFTHPFSSTFGSSMFMSGTPSRDSSQINSSKAPLIEELHSDDEEEEDFDETEKDIAKKHKRTDTNKQPYVEHPDDQTDDTKSKDVACRTDYKKLEGTHPQTRSVSFQKVTYGGINGPYYSATTTRRTGGDGVVLEECKQADITTGQAEHKISRGMLDKGHSVTRKLNSDGKVDTNQTLHNLNEDELAGFEKAWKGNAERRLPAWDGGFTFNGTIGSSSNIPSGRGSGNRLSHPFEGFSGRGPRMPSSVGPPKKIITINIQ